jgi:hypothetical protein
LIRLIALTRASHGANACADGRANTCAPTGITGDRAADGAARRATQWPGRAK